MVARKWVFGANIGPTLSAYLIDQEPQFNSQGIITSGGNEYYSGFGFHIDGRVLYSLGQRIKVGLAPSFEHFADKSSSSFATFSQPDSDYDVFNKVSLNNFNLNARVEFYLVSSDQGVVFFVLEGGPGFLSGDIPGDEVDLLFNGMAGFGYGYRLNDKLNFTVEFGFRYLDFKNEFLNSELNNKYFTSLLTVGVMF